LQQWLSLQLFLFKHKIDKMLKRSRSDYFPADGNARYDKIDNRIYRSGLTQRYENGEKFVRAHTAPFSVSGVRVPDMCTYPTQTGILRQEITVASGLNGTCGGCLVLQSTGVYYGSEVGTDSFSVDGLTIDNIGGTVSTDSTILHYGMFTGGTTPDVNVYSLPNATTTLPNNNGNTLLNGYANLNSTMSAMRIVSAGIDVQFLGSDENNQGLMTGCYLTKNDIQYRVEKGNVGTTGIFPNSTSNWHNNPGSAPGYKLMQMGLSSLTDIVNFRDNYQGRADKGIYLTASAVDNRDYEMGRLFVQSLGNTESKPLAQRTDDLRQSLGAIQWHATGLSNQARFRVFIIVHVEGLMTTDTFDVGELSTCVDPDASLQALFQQPARCSSTDRAREETKAGLHSYANKLVSENNLSQSKITDFFQAVSDGVASGLVKNMTDVGKIFRQVAGVVGEIRNIEKFIHPV